MKQRTLTIIKPDAVKQGVIGEIITLFEQAQFRIAGARLIHLSKCEAQGFYAVHSERPFFESLTTFMSSGPCMPMVLEGDDVITKLRGLMGATDPAKAESGTIRNKLASSVERNVVHGSDSPESAATEIRYFFSDMEMV